MVTYTVYMKELSATSTWQDITHAVVEDKDIPVRKGFGSLSDGIDVGSLTLTIQMESLQDAALLHVSQKQVLVQADGVTIFEGVSHDDADVDLGEVSDYVFVKLKFKPYSALFEEAKVPVDTVWMDKKICDPSDMGNSLVHLLFDMIIDNLPGQLPDILSALFNVSTAITNTKTLALVMLEAGESVEEYLTELLYQNGYAYWMELYTAIVVEPYATGRTPTVNIPITSVVANPDISQAPYIDEKKCVVRLGKIEEYTDEVVYELNKERDEKTGEPVGVQKLEPGDYYPLDSDDEPSELEADYETERENDDIELVYAEGLTYDYMARQNDPSDESKTIPAYIVFGTHELTPTQATFQLYNNLAVNVSLRNIRVLAQTAYYRNWAEKYYDESTTATEEDEIDGIWMPDSATARAFVKRYRAELKAQATHVSFQTHVALQPNTLFTITGLPYQLLVRYVTKLEEDFYEYECVAYSVDTISVGTRIRVAPKKTAQDGFSPVPVHLYALGDETAPFDTSTVVSDGTSVVSDGINRLGVSSDWTLERPTPTAGQYVWQIIGYYTPPATWPTVWSEPVRLTGDKGEQGIQGLQGLQGPQGDQGIRGPAGPDGATAYSHIAYADDAIGTGFSQSPTGKAYIGFYADHTEDDSTDPTDYAWSLIKGADGAQGIPGPTGDDGLTAYFHTAWANSADGATDFSTTVSAGKMYIGTYSDHTQDDSTDPADYAWVLIQGADGVDAKGIALLASSATIPTTSRGVPKIGTITFTAQLQNLAIPAGGLVWTTSQPGLTLTAVDEYSISIDTEDVTVDSLTVQVSDGTYIAYVTIVKVADGQPAPYNFGGVTAVPTETPTGEPLIDGDYFLWIGSTGGGYSKGKLYIYTELGWREENLSEHPEDGNLIMSVLSDFADISNDVDDTVIGNAVIKKLVALNAFIDNLKARMLEVLDGTYSLKANNSDGLLLKNGTEVLLHAPPSGGLFIGGEVNTSGVVSGDIDITDGSTVLLKTQRESTIGTTSSSPSGSLYSVDALKSGSSVAVSSVPAAASGSFGGKTISKACFRASAGKVQLGSRASGVISSAGYNHPTYNVWQSGALGANLGAQKVQVVVSYDAYTSCYFKKNGVQQQMVGVGPKYFTFDYNAADYYEVGVMKYESEYEEYQYHRVVYEVISITGGYADWEEVSRTTTTWQTTYRSMEDLPDYAPVGTRKTIYYLIDQRTSSDYYDRSVSITLTFESASSYPAGFVFINSDTSYTTLPYTAGYIDHDTHPITLNSWASSSNKPYISGSDFVSAFSAFPLGVALPVSAASSNLSSFYPVGESSNPLSSVAYVNYNASYVSFIAAGGMRTVYNFGGNGSSVGVYNSLAASVVKVTQTRGVIVDSLVRSNANSAIGADGAPFLAAYAQTFHGDVNASGTSKKVWGAVAN